MATKNIQPEDVCIPLNIVMQHEKHNKDSLDKKVEEVFNKLELTDENQEDNHDSHNT